MDQRRLLIAFALSMLVLVLYPRLVLRHYEKPNPPAPASQESARPEAPADVPAAKPAPKTPAGLAAPRNGSAEVAVRTDVMHAILSPVGARLASLELNAFRRSVAPDSQPLELVEDGAVLPLTVQLGTGVNDAALVYRPDRTTLELHAGESGQVVFTAETPDGQRLEKRYSFTGEGYSFDLAASVEGSAKPSALEIVLTPMPSDIRGHQMAVALGERGLVQKPLETLAKQPETTELPGAAWAGFAEQYFLTAVAPAEGAGRAVIGAIEGVPVVQLEAPAAGGAAAFVVYAGPKDRDALARAGHGLDRALDFGWFWFIALPLLHALRLLHDVTGNYGVAIIVLTALVKVATMPLTQATFRNMREMQKIQPQMAKLRERFKEDQAALQKEMMELYRRHRVNPFAGCLPMLLQLPIFVGLYNALMHAVELRHAPFALWINDLSAPDRLVVAGVGVPVLTLLMGASMFLQQWISPAQGDPTQQRMMMFMPLVFTFTFLNFPAGLVLYWLVNNVITIGQQYFLLRT